MAGLLPDLLPGLPSVPVIGPILDSPDPTTRRQADDDEPARETDLIDSISTTPVRVTTKGPVVTLTPANPGSPAQASQSTPTTLQTVTTTGPSEAEDAAPSSSSTISTPPTFGATEADAAITPSIGPETTTNTRSNALIPALSISLGVVGVGVILGVVLMTRYRRNKWPFNRARNFAQLDDEETEKIAQAKWDPARRDRISHFIRARAQ